MMATDERYSVGLYDPDFLNELLRRMLLIRRFEEISAQMYGLQKIGGFLHLYIGEEAVAVGSISTLDLKKDYVVTGYRDHGHALACGASPESLMAELFGKETGCSRGKGGSMHLFDAEKHMVGGNGIVGSQIPIGAGIALKIKYMDEQGVVLVYFGDGAIHQGAFHETLNLAKIWELPVVFICENNQYGMGTFYQRVSSVEDFSLLGQSYGIPGKRINGMDVLEVYEEVGSAVEEARKGKPQFIEAKTYRYKGHSMSDPARYRNREELDHYKDKDPIILLKKAMLETGAITEEGFQKIDGDMKALCRRAVDFAEQSPEPAPHSLYEDILAEG